MSISLSHWLFNTTLAIALVAPLPVLAGAGSPYAEAYMQNTQFRIYDAIPDDGIDPYVGWYSDDTHYQLILYSRGRKDGSTYLTDSESLYFPRFLPVFDDVYSVGVSDTNGAAAGGNDSPYVLKASASVSAQGYSFLAYANFLASAADIGPGYYSMILGPGTGIELKGLARVEAYAVEGDACLVRCNGSGQVTLWAEFGAPDPTEQWRPLDPQYFDKTVLANLFCGDGQCDSFSDPVDWIYLNYENMSSADEIGWVGWQAFANAASVAAAVPEPATYALMGAGIALLALRRHRAG